MSEGTRTAEGDAPLHVHWLRHERVASHRGDIPLTDEGLKHIKTVGERFKAVFNDNEVVILMHTQTRRSRDTALALYESLKSGSEDNRQVELLAPVEEYAIRNPDIYVAGRRVEMVSSAEALVEQLPSTGLSPEQVEQIPFWRRFLVDSDRVGYWVNHPDPPGENADAVARRLFTFAASLLELPRERPQRYIGVTHSPTMRAFLRHYLLGYDPGEPEYGESIDLELKDSTVIIKYRSSYKNIVL